tara:strand:- start:769 stop:1461 length:693 start_codon:yes stop_codon:yes gene_type:complete
MSNIIEEIKSTQCTDIDHIFSELYKNKSCAVVGNGSVVLEYKDGAAIDAHDAIIRCNQTPLLEYGDSVGTRTDIRIMNSHFFAALKGDSTHIEHMKSIAPKFDENYLYTLQNEIIIVKYGVHKSMFTEEIEKIESRNNKVLFLSPSFYNLGISMLNIHPTNGFIALLFAMKYFKDVSHFGFGFYTEKEKHYYQHLQIQNETGSCHDNLKERDIFLQFEEKNYIKKRGKTK